VEGFQVDLVARSFVIKAKIERGRGLRRTTNLNQSAVEPAPSELEDRSPSRCRERSCSVRGKQRVRKKGMLNISRHEFLILLLVVQPQYDASQWFLIKRPRKKSLHLLVDVRAKGEDLIE
jgi:hypothetical protein